MGFGFSGGFFCVVFFLFLFVCLWFWCGVVFCGFFCSVFFLICTSTGKNEKDFQDGENTKVE